MVEKHDINPRWNIRRPRDRIGPPIHAGYVAAIERYLLFQAPAHGLYEVCRDRAPERSRVDDQAAVMRTNEAGYPQRASPEIHLDFSYGCDTGCRGPARYPAHGKSDSTPFNDLGRPGPSAGGRPLVPARFFSRCYEHRPCSRIVHIFNPEFNGIRAGCCGDFVDERLDGERCCRSFGVAQMGRAQWRRGVMKSGHDVRHRVQIPEDIGRGLRAPLRELIDARRVGDSRQLGAQIIPMASGRK